MKMAAVFLVFVMGLQAHAADSLSLKNGREIFASYAAIMHISDHDSELRDLYKLNVDRLPKRGTTDELNNAVILATTELGGAFCKKAIDREKVLSKGQRELFGDVDFKRGPSQFNDFIKGAMLDRMAVSFWQRNIADAEKVSLAKMIVETAKGSDDTPEQTITVLQIVCTGYATSLAFLVK